MTKEQVGTYIVGSPDKYTEYSLVDGSLVLYDLSYSLIKKQKNSKQDETPTKMISKYAISKPIDIPPPNSHSYNSQIELYFNQDESTFYSELLGNPESEISES